MALDFKTFEDAIAFADDIGGPRSVLLGNGFSQAYSDKFNYGRLRDVIPASSLNVDPVKLFDKAGSSDFETVIKHLHNAASILKLYDNSNETLHSLLMQDADTVKQLLVDCLSEIHPESSFDIDPGRYESTKKFLAPFGEIFTLNYDLLLYWCSLQASIEPAIPKGDGFRSRDDTLKWETPSSLDGQQVFYLHGAMHFYQDEYDVNKLRHGGPGGKRILTQIRDNVQSGRYPLVVTEGSQADKEARIGNSPYLNYCHMRLSKLKGHLFIHGAALSENDQHILEKIASSEGLKHVYVGLFGAANDEHDKIQAAMQGLIRKQKETRRSATDDAELQVRYYPSETAYIWQEES